MQLTRILDVALSSPAKVKLLRRLVLDSTPLSGRALAREIQMSHAQVLQVLEELRLHGLVRLERIGRAHVYSAQQNALVVAELLVPLFRGERDLAAETARRVAAAVRTPALAVAMFGSVAKQVDHPESDLDLAFVVRDAAARRSMEEELMGDVAAVAASLGVRLGSYVITQAELRTRYTARDRFTRELTGTARRVAGKTLLEVISSGAQKVQDAGA